MKIAGMMWLSVLSWHWGCLPCVLECPAEVPAALLPPQLPANAPDKEDGPGNRSCHSQGALVCAAPLLLAPHLGFSPALALADIWGVNYWMKSGLFLCLCLSLSTPPLQINKIREIRHLPARNRLGKHLAQAGRTAWSREQTEEHE